MRSTSTANRSISDAIGDRHLRKGRVKIISCSSALRLPSRSLLAASSTEHSAHPATSQFDRASTSSAAARSKSVNATLTVDADEWLAADPNAQGS
jgi:hypothetical protein